MAARELSQEVGIRPACAALGVARATFYRRQARPRGQQQPRPTPARALREEERVEILDVLCSERFVDRSPGEVVATLLDEGCYLASERTLYRILASQAAVRERRDQRRHPNYQKPELLATAPNQVWSWDITKLRGPRTWTLYYLYVILDLFSRYVVGWLLAEHENTRLATRLIEESAEKQGIAPGQLVLHNDRGSPMISLGTAQLLAKLGIVQSFSRPQVSDDNPFSEAHFRTLKYSPGFPARFGSAEQALDFCRGFFPWYNTEHKHSSLSRLTPEVVHYGRAQTVLDQRNRVLEAAWRAKPERFVHGQPATRPLDNAVWLNPPDLPERTVRLLTN